MSTEPTEEPSLESKENPQEPMEQDSSQHVSENPVDAEVEDIQITPVDPVDEPVSFNVNFQTRYYQLREKELENGSLSIDEYIELFLAEVVQNLDCARQTLSRAKHRYQKESLFISIQGFLCFNYAFDFTGGIKKLKAVKNRLPKFQHYLNEIHNRFFAYGIASIVDCYSNIKVVTLASILDLCKEAEMFQLLQALNLTVDNGIIHISNTPVIQTFVKNLISSDFGSFYGMEKFKNYIHLGRRQEQSIDNLKKLMMVSDQLMKITLPPVKGSSVDREPREDQPLQNHPFPQATL